MNIPISLIFTQIHNIDKVEAVTKEWREFNRKRQNIPLCSFKQHEDLIQYCVDPSKGSIDDYLESWEYFYTSRNLSPPITREERIRTRIDFVQRAMRKGVRRLLDRELCRVDRFEYDHFNLFNGHHRSTLANFFRVDYVNVECPFDIYDRYVSRKTASIVKLIDQRLKDNKEIYQPIDIHGYYHLKVKRNCKDRLDMMRRWLGWDLKGCSTLLDIGSDFGYFCHHFERQGVHTLGIEPAPDRIEIACALNEAYGLNAGFEQVGLEEFTSKKSYDIVLAFSTVYKLVDQMQLLTYTEAADILGKLTRKFLFWESHLKRKREKEEILSVGNFRQYLKLGNSHETGKILEFGVFVK